MGKFEIKGFSILPVKLPDSKSTQYIFFKKHDAKNDPLNTNERSLFLSNLPISCDFTTIKKFFQEVALGSTVESITTSSLTNCSEDVWINLTKLTSDLPLSTVDETATKLPKNSAIVTFVDKASLQLAYTALKKLSSSSSSAAATTTTATTTTSKQSEIKQWPIKPMGSAYYLHAYELQVLDKETLSEQVAKALQDFDRAEKESIEELQQQANMVDEDGFTLVVGSHRKTKAGILGKQKLANTVESEKAKNSLKKKEKQDFYRFQLREKKKEEMNDLLSKFKADQEKVRLMREKKRFRPY